MRRKLGRVRTQSDAGITLTELMVTMLVTSLILLVGATMFTSSLRQNRVANAKTNSSSSARIAMEAVSRDTRVAVSPDGATPAIAFAGSRQLILYVSRGVVTATTTPNATKVWYSVDAVSGCLRRSSAAATVVAGVLSWPADGSPPAGQCVTTGRFNADASAVFEYYPLATTVAPNPAALVPSGTASLTGAQRTSLASLKVTVRVTDPAAAAVAPVVVTQSVTMINLVTVLKQEVSG